MGVYNSGLWLSGAFYCTLVFSLCLTLLTISKIVSFKDRKVWAKITAFECGFDPLKSVREPFSLRFYLIALLFLIFDVEIILIIPYISNSSFMYDNVGVLLYLRLLLVILVVGLFHEINEGNLNWKN